MVEIRVLRTGKALHSLFSSGSVFMVVFFSFLGYYFFFSDYILQRQSILYLRFTGQSQ